MKKYKGLRINKEKGTITLDYRDKQRKRHRETTTRGLTFAKALLAKRMVEIEEDKFFPDRQKQKLTFVEAADKYWALHLSKKKSAPKMKYTLEYLKKQFGNTPLASITTEEIQKFYNERMAETTSSTANRHLTLLNAIINKMIKLKIYKGENPCLGMVKEKEQPVRERYLTKEEIRDVLTYVPERSQNLIAFAISTGMRQGEIMNLDWKDIDFTSNIINVDKTKSGKKRRVPMMASLRNLLMNMNPQRNGKVFTLSVKQVDYDFKHALEQAKIENFRFHDLRHTFASHFMMNGGNLYTLKEILGHSDIRMTQRYAQLSPDFANESIKLLNDLVPVLV